jgi:peptidoglycan/LPS O-acetylase OafA/YrhL
MAATLSAPTTRTATTRTGTGRYVRAGLVATTAASIATTTLAAAGHAAGISLTLDGEQLPLAGFTQLTAFFALIGLALAAVLNRRARHPRQTFLRTTVVLTALSLIPDAIAPADTATKALLMTTHLVAAAIVVPAIARRLAR